MQGLNHWREPQDATMNGNGEIRQQRIRERIFTQQRSAVHIHNQAHHEGNANTHLTRLVDAPENQR